MNNKNIRICVLFGGQSSEHAISEQSATYIIELLEKLGFAYISKLGISRAGDFICYQGDNSGIKNGSWIDHPDNQPVFFRMGEKGSGFYTCAKDSLPGNEHLLWHDVDLFFPVLHGKMGEDGTIQGLFDMLNASYVGSGVLASSVSMDKVASRMLFDQVGIPQAKWTFLKKSEFLQDNEKAMIHIEQQLAYPVFVKPANAGSSIGISKAHDRSELLKALQLAFEHDSKAVLEETIEGREIELAVLEDPEAETGIFVSEAGEIIPDREFYDYESKYVSNASKLLIPAEVSQAQSNKLKEYARKAFQTVDGRGLTRADFFIEKQSGRVLLNEINTLPGFTAISMYPKLLIESGYSEEKFMETLIFSALN